VPFHNGKLNSVRLYGEVKFKPNRSFVEKNIPLYGPHYVFSMGKTPKIAHSFWDYVTPLEEDRAPAIGNMHNLADRQTHTETHTQTCSLQYFATAAAGVVIITEMLKIFICRKSMHGPRPVTPGQRHLGRVGSRVRSSDRFRLCFICHSGRDLVSD